jgi:hypothetical protein
MARWAAKTRASARSSSGRIWCASTQGSPIRSWRMIDLRALGTSPDPRQRVGQPRCQGAMVCKFSYLSIQHPRRRWLATGEGGIRHWRKVSRLRPACGEHRSGGATRAPAPARTSRSSSASRSASDRPRPVRLLPRPAGRGLPSRSRAGTITLRQWRITCSTSPGTGPRPLHFCGRRCGGSGATSDIAARLPPGTSSSSTSRPPNEPS